MSDPDHQRIFPAHRDALPQVEAFRAEVCAAAGLDQAMCLRVTLLVEELFTNTVVHGHGADSEAPVRLDCEVAPGRITLVYEDTGPPHDPFAAVASPDPGAGVQDRPVGGLGLLLVSAMARHVEYQPGAERERHSLAFWSGPAPPARPPTLPPRRLPTQSRSPSDH